MVDKQTAYILWFDQLGIEDVPLVGGKNASLGEMYRELTPKGIRVPNGFAITAYAYRVFIERTGIRQKIVEILTGLDTRNVKDLAERGRKIRQLFYDAQMPEDLREAIAQAYRDLSNAYHMEEADVAVRSSATAEDLPDASFAGQQETYLNIVGLPALLEAVRKAFASLFTNRAISYRQDKGFDHFKVALSVGVQKMVRSDKGSSGVMFTLDTETGFRNVILINAAYGLGENVVQGAVNPDQYYVFKPTLREGYRPIIQKKLGEKEYTMVYAHDGNKPTKNIPTPEEKRKQYALTDEDILTLARWGMLIEEHYSRKAGHEKPMDIEWAKDGLTGELFIVQARPETVMSRRDPNEYVEYILKEKGRELVRGMAVGSKIGIGRVHVIRDVHHMSEFQPGEVLVTDITDPDWEPIMKMASAIITNRGGRTSHAAIVSRELGIPAIVGTGNATEVLKNGMDVTVDCSSGEQGIVYEGRLEYEEKHVRLDQLPETKTEVKLIIGTPEKAFHYSFLPVKGVGLAREEFIINSYIKVHPLALIHYADLPGDLQREIDEITRPYADKTQFYIDKLAEGIGMIAAAFYPRPVIVRTSDFKSNEYAGLLGGTLFEPHEENPMIGWRGASRYYHPRFKDAFLLEVEAFKKVRNEFGLTNVHVMIPFTRTPEEGRRVVDLMESHGLRRGDKGLRFYVMAEIPSNVLLADEYAKTFDGFSIGSNDLTQLTFGLDRDSELVSHVADERHPAARRMMELMIKAAKKAGREIGICGQAPSDFPEIAAFLVEQGIDSISVNPDRVIKTIQLVAEKERELAERNE